MAESQYPSLFIKQLKAFQAFGEPIRVFVSNGVALTGRLLAFDEDTVLLEARRGVMPTLINREHIMSMSVVDLSDSTPAGTGGAPGTATRPYPHGTQSGTGRH